jgi:hypothetical protein
MVLPMVVASVPRVVMVKNDPLPMVARHVTGCIMMGDSTRRSGAVRSVLLVARWHARWVQWCTHAGWRVLEMRAGAAGAVHCRWKELCCGGGGTGVLWRWRNRCAVEDARKCLSGPRSSQWQTARHIDGDSVIRPTPVHCLAFTPVTTPVQRPPCHPPLQCRPSSCRLCRSSSTRLLGSARTQQRLGWSAVRLSLQAACVRGC